MKLKVNYKRKILQGLAGLISGILVTAVSQGYVLAAGHAAHGASGLQELNDQDLSQLVSLGGWLRGTEVLTSIVDGGFSKDGIELLHQPELVNYFDRCIGSMGSRLRKNPLVANIRDVLRKIGPIVSEGGDKITPEQVKSIHELTHGVNQQIIEGNAGN